MSFTQPLTVHVDAENPQCSTQDLVIENNGDATEEELLAPILERLRVKQ